MGLENYNNSQSRVAILFFDTLWKNVPRRPGLNRQVDGQRSSC